jgi:hypothetical protein
MLCTDIPVDVADMIKAGDIEEGLLEIVSVERIDTRPLVDPADITRTYPESRRLSNYKIVSQLIVTFRGVGWTKHGRVYFSDLAKKVGDYLTFTPLGYNLTGRIIEIEEIT